MVFGHKKRKKFDEAPQHQVKGLVEQMRDTVAELTKHVARLLSPSSPCGGFDFSKPSERQRAIDYLWAGDYTDCTTEVLLNNSDYEEVLDHKTRNKYMQGKSFGAAAAERRRARLNYAAGMIGRQRNMFYMPKHQLLMAVESKHKMCSRVLWQHWSNVRGLPSYNFTEELVEEALLQYPGCSYPVLDYVSAAVFDNYTEQMNYHAEHNANTQGQRIDMTNWATVFLPLATLPDVDLGSLGGCGVDPISVMFKPNFEKLSVAPLCHPHHPDILANQTRRWRESLQSIKDGTYFERPDYQPPIAHEFFYHPPIEGKLQSSYEDVEAELDIIRADPKHKHHTFIFVGGDGLAIHRINHTLARKPSTYLRTKPAVIPVQGEHPHGTCHVCHMGWRPYSALTVNIMTAIRHHEIKSDFTVSDFNDYNHTMCILIEGVARYFMLLEASGGCPQLSNSALFLQACSANIDLEWLVHFLHDYGFLFWDMKQAVRANNSKRIDMTWRECVSFMHTDESHKTQYAPMAILRIFWAEALHPALAQVYHANRTLSLIGLKGSNVGWDMPIEKENLMISTNVTRATFPAICRYVRQLNFMGWVARSYEKVVLFADRTRSPSAMVKIAEDVQAVVDHLSNTLGATWREASNPRTQGDSKLVSPPKAPRPWLSVRKAAESGEFEAWVEGHLRSKVTWMK